MRAGRMENDTNNKKWPRDILLGQFIAMLSATSNAASFTLVNRFGFQAPFFLLFLLYTLLSLHFFRRRNDDDTNHHFLDDERPLASSAPSKQDEHETLPRIVTSSLTLTKRRQLPRFCCVNNLQCPMYMYLLISLLDVMPNFLVLLALQYTSLTSITLLLGSLAVPSTMFFSSSRLLLSRYFTRQHYMGVCLCVVGGMLAVGLDCASTTIPSNVSETPTISASTTTLHFSDSSTTTTTTTTTTDSPLFASLNVGDLLMCTAALLYGLGDTVAEYFVKHLDRNEYLGMLGIFGMLQTSFLFAWLEHDALKSAWASLMMTTTTTMMMIQHPLPQPPDGDELHVLQSVANGPISSSSSSSSSNETTWLMFATLMWFVTCQYLYYVMEVHFLATSDATLLNLSMQSANLWAILFSVVFVASPQQLRNLPPPLFYVALVLVVSGVVLYEMDGTKIMTTPQQQQQLQQQQHPLQGRLPIQQQPCPRLCIFGKDVDDDDDDECNGHQDDVSEIESLVSPPEANRHCDYQSIRL